MIQSDITCQRKGIKSCVCFFAGEVSTSSLVIKIYKKNRYLLNHVKRNGGCSSVGLMFLISRSSLSIHCKHIGQTHHDKYTNIKLYNLCAQYLFFKTYFL